MLEKDKIKNQWDFSIFIKDTSEDAINKDLSNSKHACEKFISKWKDLSFISTPATLRSSLDDYVELMENHGTSGKAGYYAAYRTYLDQSNAQYKATYNRVVDQGTTIGAELEFFIHTISRLPVDRQPEMLAALELSIYKHFLESLFDRGKYLLSLDSEKILTLKSKVAYDNWADLSQNLLSAEEVNAKTEGGITQKIGLAGLTSRLTSPNKIIRDSSAKTLSKIFSKYEKVAEVEMNSILENKKIDDALRHMPRPDLTQHLENDVPSEVVDTLIETVSSYNQLAHRFYKLKAQLVNKPKIKYHERMIPLEKFEKAYDFYDGANEIYDLFSGFDSKAGEIVKDLLYNGQVDVFSRKGKYYSAFCTHIQKNIPQYVMLNFQNKFEDITTVAHEFGHAVNHHLTNDAQHYIYNDTPLCIAETASTFFESLYIDKQLQKISDSDKLSLLVDQLDDSVASVFRQIACYKFEQDLHSQFKLHGYLSSEDIGQLFVKRMEEYCGPYVDIGKEYRNWWVHWPHIRTYFYVFSYSFGHLLSKYLLKKFSNDTTFSKDILEFLSLGTSDSTLNLLKAIDFNGLSSESWKIGLNQIEATLNEAEKLALP